MGQFRISVAMCTYNGARFLSEQLESIAFQTRRPDELVIYDDKSTDQTVEVANAFARRAPFPVVIKVNNENLGSTKNFERAVSTCTGEVIALSDQDDVWEVEKLAAIQSAFEQHPEAGYVFSDGELVDECGALLGRKLWQQVGFDNSLSSTFLSANQVSLLLRRSVVTGATMAFPSSLKKIVLPFSPHFVHDSWISLIASCTGAYGVPILGCLIRYRQHTDQQIGARKKTVAETIRSARENGGREYASRTMALQDLRDRLSLAASERRCCPADNMHAVEDKLEHCARRARAHAEHGIARWRKVLAEILTGRYARFSNSWRSVVADLCF